MVTNVFESVDVITLIKGSNYEELNLNVGEALQKRPEVDKFPISSPQKHMHVLTLNLGLSGHLHLFD